MDKSAQREVSSDDSAGRLRREPDESVPRAVASEPIAGRLRRDLGVLESYAALLGILIGAGIFTVTSDAGALTGPSVILGYVVLFPVILATSVPYAAFLSTPLGQEPGCEYTHISQTLSGRRLAFVGAWLKIISYIGAEAFLANSLADYLIAASGGRLAPESSRLPLALASLLFFYFVHLIGVRWFGRLQVTMCALLGVSLLALIGPGLFAVRAENYRPFITHGAGGFLASLAPLFFSYAGFESLAQTAGEVKDSTRRLPVVFLKGISGAALIFVLMSIVAFGVLPGVRLAASSAPMPVGAAWFVTFGAIMAITTSMNSTMLVPSRLAFILSRDGLAPGWIGAIHPRTATPQPVARRIDHRENVAIAPARGGLDFTGLDGRVDRVSGLEGHFDDSGAEFVGSNRESETDERGACGRVGIDRIGALRLRHAAGQERDKGTRGQGDKGTGRRGDISLKMPLSPCPLVSPSPCLSFSLCVCRDLPHRGGHCARRDRPAINHRAASGDGLKVDLLIFDHHLQVVIVLVVAHGPERTSHVDVAVAHLPAGAGDEILDALLRFDAFVNVVVSGEDDVDSVAREEWFDPSSQAEVRAVLSRRGIDGVMEDSDLPLGRRLLQHAFEPAGLGHVESGRIDHEKFGQPVAFFDCVVALAAHVEERVPALVSSPVSHVVVPEHGVKLHALPDQSSVGALEFLFEVPPAAVRVDVVAHGDHEIEGRGLVVSQHLSRDSGLVVVAGPEIADCDEFDLVLRRRRAEDRARQNSRARSDCGD